MCAKAIAAAAVTIVAIIASCIIAMTGDGGMARLTTLSGVYVVDAPSGKPVTCFIERAGGSMQCIPHQFLTTGQKP